MIEDPPEEAGAAQVKVIWWSPAVVRNPCGTPGVVAGVTADDADEKDPAPAELVALTRNVYAMPLVRPETRHDVDAVEQVSPPGLAVTV